MFKNRFLNLISNDFGISGGDFLTASLPIHINDANVSLIKKVGDTIYKQALDESPQTVSAVTDVSGNRKLTITDSSVFTAGDYVVLEGNESYNNITYVLTVDDSTNITVVSLYNATFTGLTVRTKTRHDVELAGAYLSAYTMTPTLIQLSEEKSVTITGSFGQGNWTRAGITDVNKIRDIYLDRVNMLLSTYLDGDAVIEGVQMEFI